MSLDIVELAEVVNASTFDLVGGGEYANINDGHDLWMVFCGALVFFMHAGFAMLEAGNIQKTSVINIMFKNIATISIGVISYWFLGYGFAYGEEAAEILDGTTFIGGNLFLGRARPALALWFFQMVFAATAATIVSGAVAGRIKLTAYFVVATVLTAFVYPVVSHWVWAVGGWLSAFTDSSLLFTADENTTPCGVIDFAGSGVVHMTGGVAAFWGALILGPRAGWTPATADDFPPHNFALATLGTFILWFGWYGFNPGSTLLWDGFLAGHAAVTTTLSPAAAAIVGVAITKVRTGSWDLGVALNCVLGGLVSITAGCATIAPGGAVIVGVIGGIVYILSSAFVKNICKIDDPVDAAAVHGFCGFWGVIAVAFFSQTELIEFAYVKECDTGVGDLLQWQLLETVVIFGWVSVFSIATFSLLKVLNALKLDEEEQADIDKSEHGGNAYEDLD